ncbi:putative metallo-hydrolase YqgX [Halobacillus andaensis]|uniref:Metallo-hydrolase YqgX n=1 Tax=Halobacillus andaensis TaxID=1176239 RepID=A0A917ESE7_HALAA|nr:MBL fold metallo-hydrolase [Halobacillus andaensis]MBP2003102.1 glyoxylase-like metal-dependent hydrolase (beta-lactamase superfamily II) [Halobacillus andaensis]GGF08009.1 putative metallo-hydrolase YqgX [Halobacillus andaensis]
MLKITRLPLGMMGTNSYIITSGEQAIIVDPGGDFEKLDQFIKDKSVNVIAILLTHAHFDHIGAVDQARDAYQAPVYLHKAEKDWLMDSTLNGSALFQLGDITARPADYELNPGQMELGPFTFEVRHTPGHSPGSVSFVFRNQRFTVAGDTLFQRGIGRTDLPGGDREILEDSITTQLFSLRNDMKIYPGHGLPTTIEEEKNENPFFA